MKTLIVVDGQDPCGRTNHLRNAGEGHYTASDNVEIDPHFVDPDRFDFHLQKDSPAIDTGTREDDVDVDIEGTRRPQGRGSDIGAYEFKVRYGY